MEVGHEAKPNGTNTAIAVVVEKIPMAETAAKYWEELESIPSGDKPSEEWRFKQAVRRELIRLEEKKRGQLSQFIDNTNEEQQKKFEKFMRKFFEPQLLERGMRLRTADFSNPRRSFP